MIWFLVVVLASGEYLWDKPIGYPTQEACEAQRLEFERSRDIFWVSQVCRPVSERQWDRIVSGCRICLPPPTQSPGI